MVQYLIDETEAASMTKIRFAMMILLLSGVTAFAQHRVEVIITGVRDTTGVVMVGFFADSKSYLKKPAYGTKVKPQRGDIRAVIEGVPSGDYAISIIHDANRNGKLDSNFMGMPKEGFGFSNNVMGTFGPPSFEKAVIKVTNSVQISIRARYL